MAAAILCAACLAAGAQEQPPAAQQPPAPAQPPAAPPPAREPATVTQYALGDQTLSINFGPFIPLFFLALDGSGAGRTNLSLGGTGSICWAAYVTGQIRVGLEVGGEFSFDLNGNTLLMLPILAKGQYVFTLYPFEVPVGLAVGMNVVKLGSLSTIDLLLRPEASLLWIFDSNWSFGANLDWWWDMQFSAVPGESRVGNFLGITLSALYHY
jgi:hypothetical protein